LVIIIFSTDNRLLVNHYDEGEDDFGMGDDDDADEGPVY